MALPFGYGQAGARAFGDLGITPEPRRGLMRAHDIHDDAHAMIGRPTRAAVPFAASLGPLDVLIEAAILSRQTKSPTGELHDWRSQRILLPFFPLPRQYRA